MNGIVMIDWSDPDRSMNDTFWMERTFQKYALFEPTPDLFSNNPDLTAERRCRIINWLLAVPCYPLH